MYTFGLYNKLNLKLLVKKITSIPVSIRICIQKRTNGIFENEKNREKKIKEK